MRKVSGHSRTDDGPPPPPPNVLITQVQAIGDTSVLISFNDEIDFGNSTLGFDGITITTETGDETPVDFNIGDPYGPNQIEVEMGDLVDGGGTSPWVLTTNMGLAFESGATLLVPQSGTVA